MLKRILVALIFTPVVFVILFFLPPIWLTGLVMFICGLGSFELLRAVKVPHHNGMFVLTALSAVLIPLSCYASGMGLTEHTPVVWLVLCTVVLTCGLFFFSIRRYDSESPIALEHIMVCFFGGVVIPMLLSSLIRLKLMPNGQYLVLLPVISAFLTDTGAYFAGVFFGKHKGILKVSPNKSLEGFIGGILSGGLFMLLYAVILRQFADVNASMVLMAIYGLIGSAVTELGDLSFSLIKRLYGVKDYGNLLPGHGGMLDRFDSMTFAAPTLWLLVVLLPAF